MNYHPTAALAFMPSSNVICAYYSFELQHKINTKDESLQSREAIQLKAYKIGLYRIIFRSYF